MRDTKGTKFHNEAHSGPTMTGSCRLLVVALGALLSCMPLWHALPTAQTDTFRLLPNWWRLPADVATGSVTAAYPDVNGRVFVFRRAEPPILELEASGAFVRSFAADLIVSAHGIRLDSEGRIWVADVGGHAVYKLDRDGRVLLTLGKKGVKGNGPDTFNGPTDVLEYSAGRYLRHRRPIQQPYRAVPGRWHVREGIGHQRQRRWSDEASARHRH